MVKDLVKGVLATGLVALTLVGGGWVKYLATPEKIEGKVMHITQFGTEKYKGCELLINLNERTNRGEKKTRAVHYSRGGYNFMERTHSRVEIDHMLDNINAGDDVIIWNHFTGYSLPEIKENSD